VPNGRRSRQVTAAQARAYARKAEQYLAAAADELAAGRLTVATSLAIHAGINAADCVCGIRLGRRAAGQDHDEALALLRTAGPDGVEVTRGLARLLPIKTRTEYEPDDVPAGEAAKAVQRAERCVRVASRLSFGHE